AGAAAGASVVAAALSFLAFLVFAALGALGAFSFLAFLAFLGAASVFASDFMPLSVLVVACANEAPARTIVARNNITSFFIVSIPLLINRLNWPVGRYATPALDGQNPSGEPKLRLLQQFSG